MKKIDWKTLDFSYKETNGYAFSTFSNGQWSSSSFEKSPYIKMHIASPALNYGQGVFEGLKVYAMADGSIKAFRAKSHGKRIQSSLKRLMMPEIPTDLFEEMLLRTVTENKDFVPPYGTGGALYIRPLVLGSSPRLGLGSSDEFTFIIYCSPVGDYYREGVSALSAIVVEDYDRSAPLGLGDVKVIGNYASTLLPSQEAKDAGFPISLYLDAKEHRYIEEFGTSNFFAISKDNKYLTPQSRTILPSITNVSLCQLAKTYGMEVERRPILFDEISNFTEVGACGTAVVISPINRIVRNKTETIVPSGPGFGPVLKRLYKDIRAIQVGDAEDRFEWMHQIH